MLTIMLACDLLAIISIKKGQTQQKSAEPYTTHPKLNPQQNPEP